MNNAYRQAQIRIAAAIKALKQTRDEHEEYLKPIETRTRQLLIDPLLETLGWNVRNPAQVHLEYKGTSGKPDYALFSHGNVVVLIEAKKLDEKLGHKQVDQVLRYTSDETLNNFLKYVVCTNGDHWQIWPVGGGETRFQISNMHELECALAATLLLRSALEVEERGASSPAPAQTRPPTAYDASVPPTPEPSNNGDWIPLASLKIERGQRLPPNAEIKFPNSNTKPIRYWVDLLKSVAQYLIEEGKISAQNCPVRRGENDTFLVHTKPIHGTGREFEHEKKIGELWLETFSGNIVKMHKNVCWLLEQFGDPSTVLVSIDPS